MATKEWLVAQYGTVKLGGREHYLEDGDTWVDMESGEVFRGQGFDTSEVYHEGTEDDHIKSPGTATGYQQTHIVADMMRDQGFDSQKTDGSDVYGRSLGVAYNDDTETSLRRKMYGEGLTEINRYTSAEDQEAYWEGDHLRSILGEGDGYWDKARAQLKAGTDATYIPGSKGDTYVNKQMAVDEAQVARTPWLYNDVMFRSYDRTFNNEATSAFSTAWEAGWNNIYGSIQGAKAALGDAIDNEEMYQSGIMGVEEYEYHNSQLPTYVSDIANVRNAKDAGRYMSGMMGQALPYMLGIAGSAGLGALAVGAKAPALFGGAVSQAAALGAVPPAVVYAGEVYGSMEGGMDERNAAAAMSAGLIMGVLDRVGLHQMMKASSLLEADGFTKIAIELQKKQGLSQEAAERLVKNAAFDVNQEVLKHYGEVVQIELSKGILAKEFGSSFLKGAASEGITEGLQESTSYAASVAGSKREWVQEDYEKILVNAVTGGALLGGTIGSTLSTAKGMGRFRNLQREYSQATDDVTKNFFGDGNNMELLSGLYEEQGYDSKKFMAMTPEEINDAMVNARGEATNAKSNDEVQAESAADRVEGDTLNTFKSKGLKETLLELPRRMVQKGGSRLLEKYIDSDVINDESKYILAVLMDTFAPSNKSHMPGMHLAKTKAVLIHTQLNNVDMTKSEFIRIFDVRKGGKKYDAKVKDFENWLRERDSGKNAGPMHTKYRYLNKDLEVLAKRVDTATNTLWNTHKGLVGDARDPIKGYFYKSAVLNPASVRKNKELFIQTLVQGWRSQGKGGKPGEMHKMTKAQAHQLWEDVIGSPDGYQAKDLADTGFKNFKSNTLKSVQLSLKDSQVMRDTFLEKDHFEKLKSNIMSVVNHDMDIKTMGKGGVDLDRLLVRLKNEMGANWDPRINSLIKDSIAASRGDYKRIENKFLASVQGHLTFIGTVTQLDTSLLASLPEIGLLLFNAPKEHGIVGLLKNASSDLKRHYKRSIVDTAQNVKSGLGLNMDEYTQNQIDFYNFAYDSSKHGAMGHMDIGQEIDHMSKFKSSMLQAFFTLNLLKPFTDGTRVAKLSMAQDAIVEDLEIVHEHLNGGSNYAADAYERLRELNVDPVTLAAAYKVSANIVQKDVDGDYSNDNVYKALAAQAAKIKTDPEQLANIKANFEGNPEALANPVKYVLDNLQVARNSYVDNALANPTAVDRPLWYSNPHFRLATQYKGFLSTFTSHILPRVWRAAKHGNPEARYQAVAMAATMIMFGFLGQDLKDEWKYESGINPWIDKGGKFQRGMMASGLLGTPGELINIINPIYDFKRDTVDLATEFAGPFTSTLTKGYNIVESAVSGDTDRAAYYGISSVPIVGRNWRLNPRNASPSNTENFE